MCELGARPPARVAQASGPSPPPPAALPSVSARQGHSRQCLRQSTALPAHLCSILHPSTHALDTHRRRAPEPWSPLAELSFCASPSHTPLVPLGPATSAQHRLETLQRPGELTLVAPRLPCRPSRSSTPLVPETLLKVRLASQLSAPPCRCRLGRKTVRTQLTRSPSVSPACAEAQVDREVARGEEGYGPRGPQGASCSACVSIGECVGAAWSGGTSEHEHRRRTSPTAVAAVTHPPQPQLDSTRAPPLRTDSDARTHTHTPACGSDYRITYTQIAEAPALVGGRRCGHS